jgi:2-hydroxy-6-oxonona-2,4-dienedioate hydrolase
MKTRTSVSLTVALAGAASAAFTYRAFRREMERAEKRISSGSRVVNTSRGPIEYASMGDGFPLLIIHGAGGGFDQLRGFEANDRLSELGFRLIFVSRFGYLGTPVPADASTKAQADAYAALFDTLGIERAGVVAVSAGAPSGLQFATTYPDRCAALALLVPAAYVPGSPVAAPNGPLLDYFRNTLLKSDFAFWLAAKVARGTMIENILGTPLAVAHHASASERRRLHKVLMDILPVSKRRAGLLNDARVVTHLEPANLEQIKVPTLLVSAEDCLYGTFRSARYLAGQNPGARLVIYPDGGHLWVGHDAEVQKELTEFLRPLAATELVGTKSTKTVT